MQILLKSALASVIVTGLAFSCTAQEQPAELGFLKESLGIWDAEFQVWAAGLDADPMKFKGVETNVAYGEHWIASDLESEVMGRTMKVHSIVGYDLDEKKLVGKVVDEGPYAASMTGKYDPESKTVTWMTKAKDANGNPIIQTTTVTHKSADERLLVLSVPGEKEGEFKKFMEVKFVRRK